MGKKLSDLQEQQTTNTTSNRQNYTLEVDQGSDRVTTQHQNSIMAAEEVFSLFMLDLSATGADNLDISNGNVM